MGLPVCRVKNKFAIQDSAEYDGYRDMMLCLLHTGPGGLRIIGEVGAQRPATLATSAQCGRQLSAAHAAAGCDGVR